MVRIISSRKLRFYSPDRKENVVTEGKNIIQELPDWVVQDGMFKLAKNSGVISILSTRKQEKAAEDNPEKVVPQSAHEAKALIVDNTLEPTLEPGGGAEVEQPEFPANDQNDEADHLEVDKKAARKAARAARKAKKDK